MRKIMMGNYSNHNATMEGFSHTALEMSTLRNRREQTNQTNEVAIQNMSGSRAGLPPFDYYNVEFRAQYYLSSADKVIALFLIGLALVANGLSLGAILNAHGKLTSHLRLLISLTISDTFVVLSTLFYIINTVVNPLFTPGKGPTWERTLSRCSFTLIKALNTTGLNITLLNLMGMAVNHYVAILRPLHHHTMLDTTRTTVMIVCLWLIAVLCGFSNYFSPLFELPDFYRWRHKFNYCEFIWLTAYQEEYTIFAIAIICFALMTFLYFRIYCVARSSESSSHAGRIPSQNENKRKKKLVLTTLLIVGTFVVCWLPLCIFQIILIIVVKVDEQAVQSVLHILMKADQYLIDLMLLNSLLDPVIYALRIREVQLGYRRMFRRCMTYHHPSARGRSLREAGSIPFSTAIPECSTSWRRHIPTRQNISKSSSSMKSSKSQKNLLGRSESQAKSDEGIREVLSC